MPPARRRADARHPPLPACYPHPDYAMNLTFE
jgi:hypothetical protein